MTAEKLKEKLQTYLSLKDELESKDFSQEIEKELEEYRIKLIDKYSKETLEDLKKVSHYIDLINELLKEEVVIENEAKEETTVEEENEQPEDTPMADTGDETSDSCHPPINSLFVRS